MRRWNQIGDAGVERIAKRGEVHRGGIEWAVPSEQVAPILLVKLAAQRKARDRDQSLETRHSNSARFRSLIEQSDRR
ncbi:MAG: hypothetical protein ACP5P4_08925 [Steroidobacteraceae bacterium]